VSDDLAELMVESARPINFGRKYSEEEESFVAAAPEPTEEPILQMKVEVAELTETVHDATKFAAGAVVVVVVAAAAAVVGSAAAVVALPEPALGPIHFDLHLGERLKLLGRYCYSIVAIVGQVAPGDNSQEHEPSHLKPGGHGLLDMRTLH